jgi:hypothetical protein
MERKSELTPIRKNLDFNQYSNLYIDNKLVSSFQQEKLSVPDSNNIRFRYIKEKSDGINNYIRVQIERLKN